MPSINYYVCSFRPVTMMNYSDCTMWDIHHLANSLSLGRESKMFLYCLFLNNGPFWFPVQLKENLKLVWPVHVLPVIPQSLKASCKNTKATTLNFSLSRAAGILDRQSRDLGLQFPFPQTSSRQKNQGKNPQVSWTSGAVCKMWALSSVLPGTSGLSWTDPQYLPISYQHNSLWFPHYHFAHQWMYDACCLLPSTLHFFLQMGE